MKTDIFDQVTAADIMQREVLTIAPTATLQEALEIITEHHIGALPVEHRGQCIGIVTVSDILNFERDESVRLEQIGETQVPYFDPETQQFEYIHVRGLLEELPDIAVREVMTDSPRAVGPATPVKEVAALMRREGIHRVLVMQENQKLIGLISAFDFVHLIADVE